MLIRTRMVLPALVTAFFLLVCLSTPASEFSEKDFYLDLSQVVTATRLPQTPEEAPVAMTVIDRDMIERSSAIEVIDLFRLVPGMRVAYANGNLYSVVYHGYASAFPNRMQVLIDGRSVFTPLFSIVDWNNIGLTIDDIERIEVVRGSNSAAYGANAVLGTINIITRKPFQVEGSTVRAITGSIGMKKYLYRYADVADNYSQRLSLFTDRDDGFDGVNDYKKINSLSYRGIYSPAYNESLDIQLGISGGPVGSWGVAGNVEMPVRAKDTSAHYQAFHWSKKLPENRIREVMLTNNFISWDDHYVVDLSAFGYPGETSTYSIYAGNAIRTEAEFQQTHLGVKGTKIVWGGSYKIDRLKNNIILNRDDYISVVSERLFTNIEKYIRKTTLLNAGLMAENNGLVGFYVSPRLSLNQFLPNQDVIRVSATRAKRTPSLYEYYNDNIARVDSTGEILDIRYKSDPNISEETLTSYELGYIGNYFHHRLNMDLKFYYENFEDLIRNAKDYVSYPDKVGNDTWVWTNTGHTVNKGVELQIKYTSPDDWTLDAQYAYADFSGHIVRDINPLSYYPADKTSSRVPENSYSLLLGKKIENGWLVSAGYYYTDAMAWLGGGDLGPVERADLKLMKNFRLGSAAGKIALIAQNLLADYYEFEGHTNIDHIANVFHTRYFCQLEINI